MTEQVAQPAPRNRVKLEGGELSLESTEAAGFADSLGALRSWVSALTQAEHASLLIGSGLPIAVAGVGKVEAASMTATDSNWGDDEIAKALNDHASRIAIRGGRERPNIEDQFRAALELLGGFAAMDDPREATLRISYRDTLSAFAGGILRAERALAESASKSSPDALAALQTLAGFLGSFASRPPTRDRLHIFTTNYDRLIEHGCDLLGLRILDRFVGHLRPTYRSSRVDVDFHYSPPGIRGEPRYLEGVVRFTKLHGSLDWLAEDDEIVRRSTTFGDAPRDSAIDGSLIVYPNPAKALETAQYPYAELFRDFSAAVCRPNAAVISYGYGFGDEHVNRVLLDMLAIAGTHLFIWSFSNAEGRIDSFISRVRDRRQISWALGPDVASLDGVVAQVLPSPRRPFNLEREAAAPPSGTA